MTRKTKIRLASAAGTVAVLFVVAFGYFAVQYGTVSWFSRLPPELHVEGREYRLSNLPPTSSVPIADPPAVPEWYPKHHMWPLGYDIYWPRDYDTSTGVLLEWRDGQFYRYTLQGGP
ncbi:hypothetical protein [Rhodococcus sp. 077-4]|uniref:hypothetical protein n=1 Tax=Rhodococcus sp. 077-4 TaxID=2789271 RepID=UPI0039F48AEE